VSSRYDDEIWRLVPEEPGPPPDHLAEFVRSLEPVERALDLGCGDGRLTSEIRAERVTGADVSKVALDRARRRLPDRIRLVQLEPDAPVPLLDSEFALVLCAETIEHVRDVQLLLSEGRRMLRPGGRLALTTPAHGRATAVELALRGFEAGFDPLSPHVRFFTRRSLRGVLEALGFDVEAIRTRAGTLLATATR
jgi:SAM-dependent methyltransferase